SFFTEPEAVEVPLVSAEKGPDPFIDFVRGETMRSLDPHVKQAIAEGRKIKFTTAAGARFFVKTISTDDLLKMERSPAVFLELLFRKGVRDEFRREALTALARQEKKSEARVLVDALRNQDASSGGRESSGEESVAFDLVRLLTGRGREELTGVRADLEQMATT